jgi:lactoylglutathione lyase
VTSVPPRLVSTVLYVADVERAVAFYEAAIGFRCRLTDDRGVYADLETGGSTLALIAQRSAAQESCPRGDSHRDGSPPPIEIAVEVDDVPAAVERATQAGAELVRAPETKYWGQTTGFVRDLDGHVIQFCSRHPALAQVQSVTA